jgi:hypothetical protein
MIDKIIKNEAQIIISTNKDGFEFDNVNHAMNMPYMVHFENILASCLYIEHARMAQGMLHIKGWYYGSPLEVIGLEAEQFLLTKSERTDVSTELGLGESDVGFSLQIVLKNKQTVELKLNEIIISISISIAIDPPLIVSEKKYELKSSSEELLIIGGAPSSIDYLEKIKEHKGDVWALNDAVFWLEKNNIKVDKLIICDQRFVDKLFYKVENIICKHIVAGHYIDFSQFTPDFFYLYRVNILGRDGISTRPEDAYHGCTVANVALQVARFLNYKSIYTVGVLLHFPTQYKRIDGSNTMPEFVFNYQIKNIKKTVQTIRKERICIEAFENNSSINLF